MNVIVLSAGVALLLVGVSLNWAHLLTMLPFPAGELKNSWVRSELVTLRLLCILVGGGIIVSRILLWRCPLVIDRLTKSVADFAAAAAEFPLFVPVSLATLIMLKTLFQVGLYFAGYAAYGADDFSRSLSADYWLFHRKLDLGWEGWLGLSGAGWLPFSDYLFGSALALHRDLYLTPKAVNLIISAVAVVVVYLLGRELFGRVAGFLSACLFAFQPWHVWLGISGMTSDLPSVTLIALFSLFLIRWLRNDAPGTLLLGSVMLALANGFRYENWFFSAVFSLLVVFIALSRWKQGSLSGRWLTSAACALTIVNAVPVIWMMTCYLVLGDWLPALHATNAWMVGFMPSGGSSAGAAVPLAVNQSPHMAQINMLVLALGSFPIELALSIAGIALLISSDRRQAFRQYLAVLVATAVLFAVVFKGRLPGSLVFARYLLPFAVLLLPCAGYFLVRLVRVAGQWRNEAALATCLIVATLAVLDLSRGLNYPSMFPQDAIAAGWTIRSLQQAGTIPSDGKILIERATDFGDLGIVSLANRPERFVAMNELVYRRIAAEALPRRQKQGPAMTSAHDEGVRGTGCDEGFDANPCKESVLSERFRLVILSSPQRVSSFRKTFPVPSWQVGKYHIFDMHS